jgi:ribosomal protein S16
MRVTVTTSADEFAARVGALLESRLEHNILATVLESVRIRRPDRAARFAYLENGTGTVVAAALRTPPRHLLASTMDGASADALMEAWLAHDPGLPGVGAPGEVARRLSQAWERRTGGRATLAMSLALHALDRVSDPSRPARGRLRRALAADRDLLAGWRRAFVVEAGVDDVGDATEVVAQAIERRLLHLWDDGEPVALVGHSPAVAGVVRIGPVYTPPERRSRGYASSAVAALSRLALDRGARQCALYTDLANPTSNRIYAALGYRRVSDWEDRAFTGHGHLSPAGVAGSGSLSPAGVAGSGSLSPAGVAGSGSLSPAGVAGCGSSTLSALMAVRLRLTRVGGRKNPIWRVVVADQRSKRDGRVIETVGHYNAQTDPSTIVLDEERIRDWLARGAQPSDTVRKLLRTQGIS